jgi:hypothetical protein
MEAIHHSLNVGDSSICADRKPLEMLIVLATTDSPGAEPRKPGCQDELQAVEEKFIPGGCVGASSFNLSEKTDQ